MLEQRGVFEETGNLAEEGDGFLVELLGVANVCGNDGVKGQVVTLALGQLCAVLLRLDSQLATDGILGGLDVRVDVANVQRLARRRGRHGLGLVAGEAWRGGSQDGRTQQDYKG